MADNHVAVLLQDEDVIATGVPAVIQFALVARVIQAATAETAQEAAADAVDANPHAIFQKIGDQQLQQVVKPYHKLRKVHEAAQQTNSALR